MKSILLTTSAVAAFSIAMQTGAVFAQNSSQQEGFQIDRIVVTAQKREEFLEDVPISIKAYSADDIDRLQINSLTDIALLTPSVGLTEGLNPIFTDITIRGIGNIGGEQVTSGIYLDGFELGSNSTAGVGIEYDDIERIEVLRGPQGTAFGRNVIAGAISITTKDVGDDYSGFAEISAENFGGYGVKGAADLPIAPGVFGTRIAGYYRHSDGNIENIGAAGGRNNYDRYGGRITTDANFTDRLSIKFTLAYDKTDQGLENFVPDGFLDSSLLPLVEFVDDGVNPFFEPGTFPAGPDELFPQQNDTVEFNTPTNFDVDSFIATARLTYDFEEMQLVWVTGFLDNSINRFEDTDLSEIDGVILDQENEAKFASTEIRLQSAGDKRLDWIIGAYASKSENRNTNSISSGSEISQLYFIPGNVPLPLIPGLPPIALPFDVELFPNNIELFSTNFESDEKAYAFFAEAEYEITNRVAVFAGVRYNNDSLEEQTFDPVTLVSLNELLTPEFTETQPLSPTLVSFQGTPLGDIVLFPGTFADANDEASFNKVTWRAGAKWQPMDRLNLYATVSTGYRPGGLQLAGGLVPPTFGNEELTNYEVGLKSFLFDNKASLNIALFYMDWKDVQISTRAPGATFGFTDNVGKAEVRGIEFDFLAQPIEGLSLGAAFAYLDTEIIDFIDSDGFDRSGFRLPNSAEFSGNAFVEYQRSLAEDLEGYIRVAYIYNGEQLTSFNTGGIDRPPLESWERVDLNAGVLVEDNWRLELYVENLFDEIYATGKAAVGFGFSGQYVVSPPQRLGVRLKKEF